MAKAIMIYLRNSIIYLVPLARIPTGGHIETEPVEIVQLPTSPLMLGQSIMKSIELSDQLLPTPPVHERYSPAQRASDVETWRKFFKGTAACDLEKFDSEFVITPLKPERSIIFSYEPEKAVRFPVSTSPDALARRLLEILDRCERR